MGQPESTPTSLREVIQGFRRSAHLNASHSFSRPKVRAAASILEQRAAVLPESKKEQLFSALEAGFQAYDVRALPPMERFAQMEEVLCQLGHTTLAALAIDFAPHYPKALGRIQVAYFLLHARDRSEDFRRRFTSQLTRRSEFVKNFRKWALSDAVNMSGYGREALSRWQTVLIALEEDHATLCSESRARLGRRVIASRPDSSIELNVQGQSRANRKPQERWWSAAEKRELVRLMSKNHHHCGRFDWEGIASQHSRNLSPRALLDYFQAHREQAPFSQISVPSLRARVEEDFVKARNTLDSNPEIASILLGNIEEFITKGTGELSLTFPGGDGKANGRRFRLVEDPKALAQVNCVLRRGRWGPVKYEIDFELQVKVPSRNNPHPRYQKKVRSLVWTEAGYEYTRPFLRRYIGEQLDVIRGKSGPDHIFIGDCSPLVKMNPGNLIGTFRISSERTLGKEYALRTGRGLEAIQLELLGLETPEDCAVLRFTYRKAGGETKTVDHLLHEGGLIPLKQAELPALRFRR